MEYLLVNFGGPRTLEEVPFFLKELLTDRDLIWTSYPDFFHKFLFGRIAKKRARSVASDYGLIGGRSPIYFDTEKMAEIIKEKGKKTVHTFHRYLPATHEASIQSLEASSSEEIYVLPLFPQYSFATTGSIARFFSKRLSPKTVAKLKWVKSYPDHPSFVLSFQKKIQDFLTEKELKEEETAFIFSAHGLPAKFIEKGDPYQKECLLSYKAIRAAFPNATTQLSYQSKFGKGQWLTPSTEEVCKAALQWSEKRKNIVIVPLSFPSDHIETLFEIEYQYLPLIREQGLFAYRCPALNLEPYWMDRLLDLFKAEKFLPTHELYRS